MFHCLCVSVCVFTSHRMCLCGLWLVLVLGSLAHAWKIEYTAIGREEGEVCLRQNGQEWTCKKDSDCDGLQDILRENGKLRTCSWKGRSPILCCPPAKERVRRKSEEKCAEYEKLHCGDNELFVLSSQAKPLASLQRKKREDTNQPEIQTTTFQQGSEATLQPGLETTVQPNPETTFEEDPRTTTFEPYPEYVAGGHFSLSGDLPSMISTPSKSSTGEDKMQPNLEIEEPPGIIGGDFTKPAEFPSMALIGYGDANSISWQCGGTLISEHFVLSAAHCVDTPYGLARWVRLGDLDLKSDKDDARPQQLEIVKRVVHPGYHSPAFYNDVALFRLERAVVFDHYVKPACLHTDTRDLTGVGTAAGWGKNETHGPRSSALMQVDISFIPADECKQLVGVIRKYLPSGVNSTTMVCAGELGKDTCQGDSGGPLILPPTPWSSRECLARLVGVTSFGPKNCGMTSVPGAYVRVAHFVPWIESIVWP